MIATIAGRQHGVVARRQLMAAGVTADAIKHRLLCGRLHSIHRGVYAVGHAALTLEADCAWRSRRLIVELDGRAVHGTAAAFESDRARDRSLAAAGWRVVRITWRQLHDEPAAVAADLRRILGLPT